VFLSLCDFCFQFVQSVAIITGAFTFYRTQTGGFSVYYELSGNTFYIKSSVCVFPVNSLSTADSFPSLHVSGTPYVHYISDDVDAV